MDNTVNMRGSTSTVIIRGLIQMDDAIVLTMQLRQGQGLLRCLMGDYLNHLQGHIGDGLKRV